MISAFWNVFHVRLWCFRVLRSTSIKSMCPKIWGSKSKPGCRNIEIFDVSCSFPSSELPITNCLCHHSLWDNLPPKMAGFENWGSKTPVPYGGQHTVLWCPKNGVSWGLVSLIHHHFMFENGKASWKEEYAFPHHRMRARRTPRSGLEINPHHIGIICHYDHILHYYPIIMYIYICSIYYHNLSYTINHGIPFFVSIIPWHPQHPHPRLALVASKRLRGTKAFEAFEALLRQRSDGPACSAVCQAMAETWGTWRGWDGYGRFYMAFICFHWAFIWLSLVIISYHMLWFIVGLNNICGFHMVFTIEKGDIWLIKDG